MVEITPDIKTLLKKAIVAFSTVSVDKQPNTVAIFRVKVVSPNQILITDNFFNKTRKNLETNNQVSLAFWNLENDSNGAGYQLKGTAEIFTQGKWKDQVDIDPGNQGLAHKAAVLVTITEIWDLANPKLLCKS
jgi:uncharacterized protein